MLGPLNLNLVLFYFKFVFMVNRRVNIFCIWVPRLIVRVNHMVAGLIARVNHFYMCVHRPGQSPQVNLIVFGKL